jgi:hypothetical protein
MWQMFESLNYFVWYLITDWYMRKKKNVGINWFHLLQKISFRNYLLLVNKNNIDVRYYFGYGAQI